MASTHFDRTGPMASPMRTNGGATARPIHPVDAEDETAVDDAELMPPSTETLESGPRKPIRQEYSTELIQVAKPIRLFAVRDFMVHFHLHDEVTDLEEMIPVELEGFGEDTFDMLCDRLYPVYQQAIIKAEEGWPEDKEVPQEKEDAALKDVNEALTTERWRQWGAKEPEISDDPEAAWLQAFVHDFPRAAAERVVKTNHRQIIEMPPSTGEVQ